jgi:hypothetical protein
MEQAKPHLPESFSLIMQGALQSSEENKRFGIPLVIWRNGKVVF